MKTAAPTFQKHPPPRLLNSYFFLFPGYDEKPGGDKGPENAPPSEKPGNKGEIEYG